jgi:hypothetical protein
MADLNCGYQDTPILTLKPKQCKVAHTQPIITWQKMSQTLFDKLYQQPDATRLIGIRFSDSKECVPVPNKHVWGHRRNVVPIPPWTGMKDRYGFDAVMRCAGATSSTTKPKFWNANHNTMYLNCHSFHPALRHHSASRTHSRLLCNVEAMALTDINTVTEFMIS